MPNNTGMIFGRVTESSGAGIADVDVTLNFILGEVALGELRVAGNDAMNSYVRRATTNGDGKYVLPFFWDSVDIAKVTAVPATVSILAMKFWPNGTYTSKNQRGRAILTLDIKKLIAVGYSNLPNSTPDAVNIAKDFYVSYKDMLPKHGVVYPSTPLLSTEVFGLLGRIDVVLW